MFFDITDILGMLLCEDPGPPTLGSSRWSDADDLYGL